MDQKTGIGQHPVQIQQQPGFQGHPPMQQQGYPSAPPNYDGTPNIIHQQQPVVTQPTTTIIVHNPHFGSHPERMTCPSCHANIVTSVMYEPSAKTHLAALLLCLTVCCCCLPYCIDSCQSARHSCPSCGSYLGTFE